GPALLDVSQVDPLPLAEPVEVTVDSGAAWGAASGGAAPASAEPGGAEPASAEPGGAEPEGAEPGGAESEGAESWGAEPEGAEPGGAEAEGAEPGGAESEGAESGGAEPRGTASAEGPSGPAAGGAGAGGAGARDPGAGGPATGGTGARGAGATGSGGVRGTGARDTGAGDTGAGGAGAGGAGAGDPGAGGARAGGPGARGAGAGATGDGDPGAGGAGARGFGARCFGAGGTRAGDPGAGGAGAGDPGAGDPGAGGAGVGGTGAGGTSTSASALFAELVDFAAACRLDYAASLVAESESDCPPSVGGECGLGMDVLEDRQEDFECFATAVPHLVAMVLAPEGDPDAPDIPTPRSYAEAITGPYSSQWQTAMDAEMASWKSTGTYIDAVPPPGANIGVDFFQAFSPTPKMTTLRVLLHVAVERDYELHSLDFSTAFLQGSLHEEIWLRRPPGFTGSFPASTQWSLRRPVYSLRQVPREWHNTLRTTLAALGFAPSIADPSMFLRTDTSLPPFYVLVYVDNLVFATADTEALALVLQRLGFRYSSPQSTPLPTGHSLLAPPSDESVEPSGPYPELVGCLMYLMTCTRPDLAYPLSILARYVAPGRHRREHWEAAKRVLRYLCCTSGMGLVLGGRGPVVLTGHADASWVDDLATQRSSQGYTFSLGSVFVSWQSTRSSSVLSSSCEAEIYAGAMAAQELRWLTYLLTDLEERPRSSPVLYVDNKAMITLCKEH
ncbi:unnamed protein product, partial [Closterium sp. NIES-54]